jgi:Predicted membrane protein
VEFASIVWLLIVNILIFILMLVDKNSADQKMWRIPEKALWVLSLLGGSVGFLVAMVVSHHKILKPEFKYGVSLIYLIESTILYFVSKDLSWIVALTIFSLSLILVAFKIFLLKDNPNKRFKNNKRDKK